MVKYSIQLRTHADRWTLHQAERMEKHWPGGTNTGPINRASRCHSAPLGGANTSAMLRHISREAGQTFHSSPLL